MFLTDPPYNINYNGKTDDKLTIKNDAFGNEDEFVGFLSEAFSCAAKVMKPGAAYYIWHSDSHGLGFRKAAGEQIGDVREVLIWNKNSFVLGRQDYHWKHEPCLYGWKSGGSHQWFGDRSQSTVMDFEKPIRNGDHPTMKPVALFDSLIKNSSKTNDVILDLFGGSGTTMVASEQLKRKCYMMELDPHYCDVIIARWEKLTGKEAVRLA